jgi:hypothetical protein
MMRAARRSLLGFVLLLAPLGAAAQTNLCPGGAADFDADGFSDAQECAGIALRPGLQLAENAGTLLPSCAVVRDRRFCVDPATRDAFVILDATTERLPLPPEALDVFAKLGIVLHELVQTSTDGDRTISTTSTQRALQLATNADSASGVLGRANWGTPNNLDGATVFPNRAAAYVNGLCAAGKFCTTHTGRETTAATIIPVLTRWVADHEAGHTVALSAKFDKRYGGYHEASGSLTVMEQTPKVVDKRGTVTFYIGNAFSAASAADAQLAGRK